VRSKKNKWTLVYQTMRIILVRGQNFSSGGQIFTRGQNFATGGQIFVTGCKNFARLGPNSEFKKINYFSKKISFKNYHIIHPFFFNF
jgi:hypothetical protein